MKASEVKEIAELTMMVALWEPSRLIRGSIPETVVAVCAISEEMAGPEEDAHDWHHLGDTVCNKCGVYKGDLNESDPCREKP